MTPEAIASAEEALRRAKTALAKIRQYGLRPLKGQMPHIVDAWTDLLIHGNRVYGKLEKGAKRGPAQEWFKAIKAERNSDAMLHYLHEARNADDHGVQAVAEPSPASFTVTMERGKAVTLYSHTALSMDLDVAPGQPGATRVAMLCQIDCRGSKVAVPQHHLGQPIEDSNPLTLGELFVARLEAIVSEARAEKFQMPSTPGLQNLLSLERLD